VTNVDVLNTAGEIRQELARDVRRGVEHVARFADEFAVDRELLYQALLLNRQIARGAVADDVRETAESLVARIVADYEQPAAAARIAVRSKAIETARERALQVPVPRSVVFSCANLGKRYRRTGFSLHGVSFEMRFGTIRGVVGRNGNGKTTLFRLIVGELDPTEGSMEFPAILPEGGRLRWGRVRQQIAYVPQELPRWYGSLKSNLHYEAAIHGIRGADNEREVDYIVERLGLGDELDKGWRELAGGFKLRFALARALVWKPKLLVLDEPLANLDFTGQQIVLKDLRNLTNALRYPLAVLISSQHLHEIEEISDDILFLRRGAVAYSGPTAGIGRDRARNTFELGGSFDLETLQRILEGPKYLNVYHSGVSYVIKTTLDVSAAGLMRHLLDANLPLDYFRDVSQSTKSLFEEESHS
jgi:ABC-type multidrug transport system ATPase subunit